MRARPAFRNVIVGNEPNLNRYWLPQFNDDGSDAAAPAYEALLARTYDALKAVDPGVDGARRRGLARAAATCRGIRPTHSPTVFIRDLGAAYRASGRTLPIMDGFAFHPYEDNSSVAPLTGAHPNSTTIAVADYDKLVALLGEAFDGTAQRGSTLPILYDEFGVETQIPPAKAELYTGTEPATTKPVDEATQARYYRQALALAFCQPNVRGIFLFHAVDEPTLARWQSGVYYADGTPKASLGAVRAAIGRRDAASSRRCHGLALLRASAAVVAHGGACAGARAATSIASSRSSSGSPASSSLEAGRRDGGARRRFPARAGRRAAVPLRRSARSRTSTPGRRTLTILVTVRHG